MRPGDLQAPALRRSFFRDAGSFRSSCNNCELRPAKPILETRLAELRVIANWLAMSQNFMQMSIKTMELQKASLEAMRAATAPAKPAKRKPGSKIEGA